MSSEPMAAAAVAADRLRWSIFGRSMLVVLAWHAVPVADVIVGAVVATHQPAGCVDTCFWVGYAWFVETTLVLMSLILALAITAVLSSFAKRGRIFRRVAFVGNVGSITGMVLTPLAIYWLALSINTWLSS